MKRTAWLALALTAAATGMMLLGLRYLAYVIIPGVPADDQLEYYKLAVEILKIILVGFGAALFGILFPAILSEARASFERLRDSRSAYSEAKTAGDYLALRLCALDLKAATSVLQRAHAAKHAAELYPELARHLRKRGDSRTPEQWGDNLYNQYFEVRRILEMHAADWDTLNPRERLLLIRAVVPDPKKAKLAVGALDTESQPP